MIDARFESLGDFRFKGAWFAIHIRCDSLEAKIRRHYNVFFFIKPRRPPVGQRDSV